MRKKLTTILAITVTLIVAVGLMIFPLATDSAAVLDVSKGDGITFDNKGLWLADEPMSDIPASFEAWVYLPSDWEGSEPGSVMGNYKGAGEQGFRFRLREADDGSIYPNLMYTVVEKVESNANKQYISYNFTKAKVPTDKWVHIAITDAGTGGFKAYIDGEMMHSASQSAAYAAINKNPYNEDYHFVIGAEQATGSNPFKGQIRSVALYNDVRTQDEINADMASIDLTDANLISAYLLNGKQNAVTIEDAAGNYNMTHGRRNADWARPEEMPDLDEYDYSIAIIGDTQAVNKYYPEYMGTYFDWILENKEEHKIQHVLNLGDITNNNEDAEWERARDNYFRLNGKVDYTLVRGDHDILLSNNKGDGDTSNDNLPGGDVAKYDRFFDVPEYTDRFTNSADADYYKDTDPNKSNGSITNSYRVVTLGTQKYLIVTVDKFPSEAVMEWLDEGITAMTAKYPDIKIIMTMHCFIQSDGGWVTASGSRLIGESFWNRIKHYSNLEYVICGHDYAWGVVWLKQQADDGHIVNQILVNPQGPEFDWQGASAMVAMLYVNEETGDVQVRYYSATNDRYYIANENPITEATAGEKAKYALTSGMFTMNTRDASVATQLTSDSLKEVEYIESNATISAVASGSNLSINYSAQDINEVKAGKIVITYDSSNLSDPMVAPDTFNMQKYDGKLIVTWDNFTPVSRSTEGTLFTVDFVSDLQTGEYAEIGVKTEYLGYNEGGKSYYDTEVVSTGTVMTTANELIVEYKEGDSFKEKVEEALSLAKYSNVKLVMKTGFTASSTKTVIGNADDISRYTVYVTSEEGTTQTIDVNDKYIIFSGNFNFNNIKLGGGALANTKNAIFFTEGSKAVFGDNVAAVSASDTTSVCGDWIEVYSGTYHYVGGAIIEGYTVQDPTIKILGNTKVTRAVGGACLSGDVIGRSYIEIGGTASCDYAVASSYAVEGSVHSGDMVITTTGEIARACAAIAPCGSASITPNYTVTISNAKISNIIGVRFLNANKKGYADVDITINSGEFEVLYGGINVDNTGRTGVMTYGTADIIIKDGSFSGGVYGAGILGAANSTSYMDTTLAISGGEFASGVFGGARFNADNCVVNGNTTLNISGTPKFTSQVMGGSYIDHAGGYHAEGKNSYVNISGGTFTGFYGGSQIYKDGGHHDSNTIINITSTLNKTIYGGSFFLHANNKHNGDIELNIGNVTIGYIYSGSRMSYDSEDYPDVKNGEHSGDIYVTLDGTTVNDFFGGSLLESPRALQSGNSTVNIYANSVLKGHMSGGAKLWYNGNGHRSANDTNTGVEASGNVTFNVYKTKKDGSAGSAVTMASGKRLFIAAYGTTNYKYQTMSGDVNYYINGVALPTTAYGGVRGNMEGIRTTGDIKGTLENVTFTNFYGGSELSASGASDEGNIELTLKNVNVTGIVAGGSNITNAGAIKKGTSTLNYESGTLSGTAIGGCYFTKAGVKIDGDSKLVFGTANTTPTATADSKLVGGSLALASMFTGEEAETAWGIYGSSDLVIKGGTVESGAYVVGGSFFDGTANTWANYPYVGGNAGSTEHQKLKIEGGTVNGPMLYAGSYCNAGGQDHGTVELEIAGGTVNINITDKNGIYNYGKYEKAIYPATYYPTNTKNITVNSVFKFMGGKLNMAEANKTNVSGGMYGYNAVITGDTELTLNVDLKNGSSNNANVRVLRTVGGITGYGANARLVGNSTLNILNGLIQPSNPATAGCYSDGTNIADTDANDGITNGFVQTGDVTFNMQAGTLYRSMQVAAYGANLDGNVFVNISGGTISRDLTATTYSPAASSYASVTGDVVWNVSGGTITGGAYVINAGGAANDKYGPATGYNVIGGDIYFENSGCDITGTKLSLLGTTSLKEGKEARIKLVGDASSVLPATAGQNCVIDLTQYTGSAAIDTSNYSKVYNVLNGKNVTVSGIDTNATLADIGDVSDSTFTWNGSEATYAELTKFDKYSANKNSPEITQSPVNTGKLVLKVGRAYSAELFDTLSKAEEQLQEIRANYALIGTSVRTGKLAFRCRAKLNKDYFEKYNTSYANGYKITRVGILVSTKSELLELGGKNVSDAWAWADGQINPNMSEGFASDAKFEGYNLFQAAVTGFGEVDALDSERVATNISFRGYINVEFDDGSSRVIYLDNPIDNTQTNYVKSLYSLAEQIKNAAESDIDSEAKQWYNTSVVNKNTVDAIWNSCQ